MIVVVVQFVSGKVSYKYEMLD